MEDASLSTNDVSFIRVFTADQPYGRNVSLPTYAMQVNCAGQSAISFVATAFEVWEFTSKTTVKRSGSGQ